MHSIGGTGRNQSNVNHGASRPGIPLIDGIAVSIDPADSPDVAGSKKANYVKVYGRPSAERGFHFLTGSQDSIRAIADSTSSVGVDAVRFLLEGGGADLAAPFQPLVHR